MNDDGADAYSNEPGSCEGDGWLADMANRISEGEAIDLDTLVQECPDGVARLRVLMPTIAMMARLMHPSRRTPGRNFDADSTISGPEPGVTLGDFRTIRVIGRGGMGIVYEAVQVSLNRRVALKILPSSASDDRTKVKRFLIEAQAAACLHHAHIVPVHVVGSQSGLHYYAMQFIEGQTLADVIATARRTREATTPDIDRASRDQSLPRRAAELGRQAALALHFAHEQGIVHRDIKPSNLLIDDNGWLWISDFGLARIAGQAELTLSGAVLGTLRYMSPEQAFGTDAVVDHRTDIYSLGATLYELITLHPVFEGDDRLRLFRRIAEEDPPAPRRIDPAIPRDLDTIVCKAMAKEPGSRYATAGELADDLGRFLENRPILARPPGAVAHATKWMRRHRLAVAAAGLVVVGLAGASLWRDRMVRSHDELRAAINRAEERESARRWPSYDSQIRLAQRTYSTGHLDAVNQILEGLMPQMPGPDPRGFEWYYLRRLCHLEFSVLSSHRSVTTAIAVSPDGRTLVSGHLDGVLVFCDLALGQELARVATGEGRKITNLWFSPDGPVLTSTSAKAHEPDQVTLWDPTTVRPFAHIPPIDGYSVNQGFSPDGKVLLLLARDLHGDSSKAKLVFWDLTRGPEHPVAGVAPTSWPQMACSPDGRWLATSATSGKVILRDATNAKSIKTVSKSFSRIGELAASVDGRLVAVADSTDISIWDVTADRELGTVAVDSPGPLTFSPDGNRLASLTHLLSTRTVELITDVSTKPRRVPLEGGANSGKVAFSPDGRKIAARGTDGAATLWDTTSGRIVAKFARDIGHVGCVAFTPDGETLLVAGTDGPICAWRHAKTPKAVTELAGHKAEVWGLAFTPDGKTLVSTGDYGLIKLWDAHDGRLGSTLKGHTALATSIAVNRGGTLLASASFDKTVRLWELPSGKPRSVLRGHSGRVRTVRFSPDGRLVASAGDDKTVRIWDAESGSPTRVIEGHTDVIHALAFDPTGTLLVSASNDQTIRGNKVSGGEQAFSLPCSEQDLTLAFSPDGSLLAAGDNRGGLTLWNTSTWSRPILVKGTDTPVLGLNFSPDGRTLAAACGDAKVRLWDPITGQVMLVLEGHAKRVNAVAFSPDGQTLASASHDGAIRLWHAERP